MSERLMVRPAISLPEAWTSGSTYDVIAECQLSVAAAVVKHGSKIEDGWIQQRAPARRAVDEPGAVWQPGKTLQPCRAGDLVSLTVARVATSR